MYDYRAEIKLFLHATSFFCNGEATSRNSLGTRLYFVGGNNGLPTFLNSGILDLLK